MALAGRRMPLRRAMAVAAAVLIAGVATTSLRRTVHRSPAGRLWTSFSGAPSIGRFFAELWNRNGYGSAADAMIREFPVGGVGIGNFYGFSTGTGNASAVASA